MKTDRLPLLLTGLAFSALLLVATLFVLLWQGDTAKRWVLHTSQVQLLIERLLGALRDEETGQRGYLLTSDAAYLEPFESATATPPALLTQLRDHTSDNPAQQARTKALDVLMQRKLDELAETVALQKAGEHAKAVALVNLHQGQNVMDQIRGVMASMQNTESALLVEREAKTDWLMTLALGACAALGSTILGLGIAVFRQLAAQVDQLESVVADRTLHLGVVTQELAHRTKNQLALVQSIANQTARHSPDIPDFLDKFGARLQALGRSISELTRHQWRSASLADLVASQIDWLPPAITRNRITSVGPHVLLPPTAAHYLGLALHELLTNAVKHGALSNDTGRIGLVWSYQSARGPGEELEIVWTETGGPPLSGPPVRSGFGSTILSKLTAAALHGEATMDFRPAGVQWRLSAPAPQSEFGVDSSADAPVRQPGPSLAAA